MPNPKISVIVVTARMGCFDVLVNGFKRQTMPEDDYEVIVVDSCYAERRDHLPLNVLPRNFRHVELPNERDYYDACFANNFGLRMANGELIVFFSDLNWPDARFLEDHWSFFKNLPGYSMTGFCDRYPVPPLKKNPTWEDSAYSIFEQEFTASMAPEYFSTKPIEYRERKGKRWSKSPVCEYRGLPVYELPGDLFYGSLNESIPMSVLREIDGWDQLYDGAYGSADIDLGVRANFAGWKFVVCQDSINVKFGTQGTVGKFPGRSKPRLREPDDNYRVYESAISAIKQGRRSYKAVFGAWQDDR